ncbi:amidohydrolase [uncultured Paraglaciecola sp.]|uniref:amidohydrolase n=1 Tax=uncultured Paraglaciecola sp. TaxID=1765024 RepID=UPI00260C0EA6|nr:amidohydrolase [uncultured Paraglaciecola sp.]
MKALFFKSVVWVAMLLLLPSCSKNTSPNTVLYNGVVISLDEDNIVYEAMAIKDGKISQLGSSEEILALAADTTKTIDLAGDTLIPGFVGVHEHPTLEAIFASTIDISGFSHQSAAQMWQFLQQQISNKPEGDWVFAMGIDPILFPDMQLPTKRDLDKISPNNPLVLVSQTMHSFWANSRAFAAVNVTAATPDPGHGSYYQKNDKGELTGFIAESEAAAPFLQELKSPLRLISNYETVLDGYLAAGFTTVASLGINVPKWIAKYAALESFDYKIRQFFYLTTDEIASLPEQPDNGDDFFAILGVKLWHDGSPYTGSMQLAEHYTSSELTTSLGLKPDDAGASRLSKSAFLSEIEKYSQKGWQLAIHSQGDLSSQQVADVMSSFQSAQFKQQRHRIEHGLLISTQSLQQMAKIGMTPSFHINHIYYYGDALSGGLIGPERAQSVLRVKDAFDLDMHPTLHADGPMFPAAPFHLMQTAITRKSNQGLVLGASQSISKQQGLKALTYNGAWQLGLDNKIGSIEQGKYADFVRLSSNPLETPTEHLTAIQVLETWVAGKAKFIKSTQER